jgi:hypothetical protein
MGIPDSTFSENALVPIMPLTRRIQECYRKAANAKRKAEAATAPSIREDFLGLERRWLLLAQSWELSQRLGLGERSSEQKLEPSL